MKKAATPRQAPADIQDGVEEVMRSVLAEYHRNPKLFSMLDKLRIIQYFGTYLNRRYGWDYKYDDPALTGGQSVRKYTGAFKTTNAGRRGKASAGSVPAPTGPRLVFDEDDRDGDDLSDAL